MKYLFLSLLVLFSNQALANCEGTAKNTEELVSLIQAGLSFSELRAVLSEVDSKIEEEKIVAVKMRSTTCVVIDVKAESHLRKGKGIRYLFALKNKQWILDSKSIW